MCGPPSLVNNIGPLLLSQCNRSKNVILLLEHSADLMSEDDVTRAHIFAKAIIHMLSETDRVTVIGLAGTGSTLCTDHGLARATDVHKIRLDRHIDQLIRTRSNDTFRVRVEEIVRGIKDEIVIIHLTNSLKNKAEISNIVESVKNGTEKIVKFKTILIMSEQKPNFDAKDIGKNGSTILLPTQRVLGYEIAKLFAGKNSKN